MIRTAGKWLLRSLTALIIVGIGAFWLLFFSARPPLSIDPATLAGDGSMLNYCTLPVLDGSGLAAADIPKGNTPGCAYDHFPLPILRACTEPLVEGADDIRGLWLAVSGKVGHVERIEQCGARTVITASGIIHDAGPNATGGLTSNDTEGSVLFTIGDNDYCARSSAGMSWNDNRLNFKVFGWGPVVVRRYLQGQRLVWEYADGSVTHLQRICTLPEAHKQPTPRGPRYQWF
ncbi:MAG: hypothetical protein AB8B93_07000 [Pseudomonadales bacterium]